MTTDSLVFIAPLETVAPVCSRCGQLVWSRRDRLIDSRGRMRCPAPWWRRLLVVDPHTVEPVSGVDVVRHVFRMALAGMGVFAFAALAVNVVSFWY